MAELTLRVITPDAIIVDAVASSIRIPALDGLMGILPRHAAMVASLDSGVLTYQSGGKEEAIHVSGGFCEVRDNTVRIVSEAGEVPSAIDEERALEAEKRARVRLDEARRSPQVDILRAELALRRAQTRLLAKRGYGRTLV